ncbi:MULTISPECIES: DUF2516 family protein [unclassified Streptomyces]|uniref:DUF2516 family protein n=1 Tax=unclassified Streptomyces TaxID=2593676 RepID=UPI001C55B5C4|nr:MULTISPECIES: DUF2516 family protein [unclassified Streptomyces]MBW1599310.1 DUF2516 family protein [Streptomyces sp. JJ38]MCZ7417463.1 DUF2516 family protein [Streptomyces sp. WMMC897]MCZ7432709.1 DUF2516 family protein [Streptomyces sp. WMMC1477]
MILNGFGSVMSFVFLGLLILSIFCFVDAALRREDAYRAADKNTKPFWLILLGIGAAVQLFGVPFLGFLLLIVAVIANIVYLVDVRPALIQVTGGRGGGGRYRGSSSDGPYGPYNGGR